MYRAVVKIGGMACGMCESHINDVIRKTIPDAKKVSSSHRKGEATFLTETSPEDLTGTLKKAIEETGYHYLGMSAEPYEKKRRLFF